MDEDESSAGPLLVVRWAMITRDKSKPLKFPVTALLRLMIWLTGLSGGLFSLRPHYKLS